MTDPEDHRTNELPQRPPSAKPFSMRAAMLVPALGVVILGVFITLGFVTSNPVQQTKVQKTVNRVGGTALHAIPGERALKVITKSGEPPGNILNAVSIPEGATVVSHQTNSALADQFDSQINLHSDATQGALENFYQHDMKAQGWQIFETGPADHDAGAIEVLGKKAGSDGFYWEMGAVVSATTFGPGAPATGETDFTVRLFQVPDPD
jgi:hypothetical protein